MKAIFVTAIVFLLSGCSTYKPSIQLSSVDEHTLRIVGVVDPETERDILQAIEKGVKKIIITSGGGEVRSSIRVANAIKKNGISLEVVDYCMSSCFNYLFLAAKERYIRENSVLGFHGTAGTSLPGFIKNIGMFADTIKYEDQFIREMGFDEDIYEKLSDRAEKIIKESGLDANLFMVGKKFFDNNQIKLKHAWFPKNQMELNKTVSYIVGKYGKEKERYKTLIMVGDFND